MKDTLFPLPESLSPRLAWMKEHGILTCRTPNYTPEELPWMALMPREKDSGKDFMTIFWESCRLYEETGWLTYGQTEDEAIVDLAKKSGLKLWNGA